MSTGGASKHWCGNNLPEDLWPLILSALPVKSLLRFRSVSKPWRSLIDDPGFARLHLRLFSNNRHETHLLFYPPEKRFRIGTVELTSTESFELTSRPHIPPALLERPGPQTGHWHALSSMDGLFLLKTSKPLVPELMLWNPATRKTLILPPSPSIGGAIGGVRAVDLGLGFDPSVESYKHVRLYQAITGSGHLHSIAVYSLAKNSWKTSDYRPGGVVQRIGSVDDTGFCVSGFVYRLASINGSISNQLIWFDLRKETLDSISLPQVEGRKVRDPAGLTTVDEGRSLAVVLCTLGSGSVWVLKLKEWSKRYTIKSFIPEFDRFARWGYFIFLTKNGELLFKWDNMVTSYNLNTNKEKVVFKDEVTYMGLSYIENLLAFN